MQFLPFIFMQTKMNPEIFYGEYMGSVAHTRVPPDESNDICLSDNGDRDEPKPGDENRVTHTDICL